MGSANLLDLNEIRQLVADMGGDQEIIPGLVDSLESDTSRSIREMQEAVESADGKRLKHAAHRLKGSCSSLGAKVAASLCQELETMGQNNETADAAPMIERLEGICVESIKALREVSL